MDRVEVFRSHYCRRLVYYLFSAKTLTQLSIVTEIGRVYNDGFIWRKSFRCQHFNTSFFTSTHSTFSINVLFAILSRALFVCCRMTLQSIQIIQPDSDPISLLCVVASCCRRLAPAREESKNKSNVKIQWISKTKSHAAAKECRAQLFLSLLKLLQYNLIWSFWLIATHCALSSPSSSGMLCYFEFDCWALQQHCSLGETSREWEAASKTWKWREDWSVKQHLHHDFDICI